MVKKAEVESILNGGNPQTVTGAVAAARMGLRKARASAGRKDLEEMTKFLLRSVTLAYWVAGNTRSEHLVQQMDGLLREVQRIDARARGVPRSGRGGH
jgi:hypothetical protein